MIKSALEKYIQKSKNPTFTFDSNVTNRLLFSYAKHKVIELLRGLRVILKGKIPKRLFIGRGVRMFNARNIEFGRNVLIGEYSYLDALGSEKLSIGDNTRIGPFCRIITSMTFGNIGKGIKIGSNVSIGEFSSIGGAGGLEIGSDTIIGGYLSTHPENHVFANLEVPIRLQGVTRKGIKLGANCWIGAKVTVLDGVEIGNGCIIAAGAVLTKSFGDNVVIGGVPAKVIKKRKS